MSDELTDFLLARIREDEDCASRVLLDREQGGLISHAPHVLAECEAKRRIVEDMSRPGPGERAIAEHATCILALPYANHPEYREAWKP